MFGRSMFRDMEDDPFFSGFNNHMADGMFRDPFHGMGMLEGGQSQDRGQQRGGRNWEPSNQLDLRPFGGAGFNFGNMFGNMDSMMQDMNRAFTQAGSSSNQGNGQMFQQSSFMSYNKSREGPPKVFQASQATRTGPGGVRETKRAVRDSERELEKMAIGHHIHDRGHEIEKHRNTRSGQVDEMQNYHNIDEKDAESFNREWQDKTRSAFRGMDIRDRSGGHRRELRGEYAERPVGRRGDRREVRVRPRDERRGAQLALPAPPSSPGGRSEHWVHTQDDRERDRS